ncbi:MAG TPA: NAD(P)/FAD-dependent oxidoreductase [Sediminibacterium sp.]|uniref:NAD(P)/FAD-dependent oxidoreductase n=1 Tax=Sediminibacterium sp. TaxID=1917865 RepID=UPI0026826841|nr:NAD(P)/FAD-dependent oxidoreductase [Sediminibacterium sp.]HLD52901.1 NAD(P)/FAD-dependent oxidoreductase [Sediminibacterium sp.]
MYNMRYDIAIVGGGLAGLALSIQSAKAGFKVVLFEKEQYPFHKVCGEYISLESWDFIESLGVPLSKMQLPIVNRLMVTAPNGNSIEQPLDLGGFGISRYTIDKALYELAKGLGVRVEAGVKVDDIVFEADMFSVHSSIGIIQSRVAVGSFGKRSNLDVKWKRPFILGKQKQLDNFIGVKYHIDIDWPKDLIALHNFKDGYCGISNIEDGKTCLCYLTTAQNLKTHGGSIEAMEELVLKTNPYLKEILENAVHLYEAPVTIAQISFERKSLVEHHVLMVGDAGGMITPLCGNGMSMALHGSKLAYEAIAPFLRNELSRESMEQSYARVWTNTFGKRLTVGRWVQGFFGKTWMTNLFITMLKPFPFLVRAIVKQTHGERY